ncbi:MAG: hypothetical protein CL910_03240 [Deltaproteobacteria bacterium]|jgi:signal transduction histidine kinase|nr:hypothetical protein [Deltaproteobacteria bacterium]
MGASRPAGKVDHRAFPVLYVDDEPENLRVFELTFRRDFEVLTATSGEEGLDLVLNQRVALVLSDHKMPGMTGAEFLARVRDVAPETIRMLVTAYGSAETLAHAINDGSIYRYVPKPWQPEEMRVALRRGIEVFAMAKEREGLVQELQTVNRIAETITRELSLDRLLDLLVTSLTGVLSYDGASLLLFEQGTERLRMARTAPAEDEASRNLEGLCLDGETAGEVVDELAAGRAQFFCLDECFAQPAPIQRWLTELASDVLAVPLLGKDAPIGVLAVDNRKGGKAFDASDRTLLEGIGQQAAVAIQNARLVEDLRQSRQQVLRADRLGTLGTLAAGFAHEINNPLTSIHTFLSLAVDKRHQDDTEFWGDYHRLACSEVERIRGLVSTLSRLGREELGRAARSACDLATLAREAITLITPEADRRHVSIDLTVDPAAPKIHASREQLHQLCLNLLLNAVQASPPDARVAVAVLPGGPGQSPGATLEVVDGGGGIAEDDLERIFDPFFTTKGPDQGTGLGLMICHRIVSDHEGLIEVSSRAGEGATFRVRLPAEMP